MTNYVEGKGKRKGKKICVERPTIVSGKCNNMHAGLKSE